MRTVMAVAVSLLPATLVVAVAAHPDELASVLKLLPRRPFCHCISISDPPSSATVRFVDVETLGQVQARHLAGQWVRFKIKVDNQVDNADGVVSFSAASRDELLVDVIFCPGALVDAEAKGDLVLFVEGDVLVREFEARQGVPAFTLVRIDHARRVR
jgi:hypothetical protein